MILVGFKCCYKCRFQIEKEKNLHATDFTCKPITTIIYINLMKYNIFKFKSIITHFFFQQNVY